MLLFDDRSVFGFAEQLMLMLLWNGSLDLQLETFDCGVGVCDGGVDVCELQLETLNGGVCDGGVGVCELQLETFDGGVGVWDGGVGVCDGGVECVDFIISIIISNFFSSIFSSFYRLQELLIISMIISNSVSEHTNFAIEKWQVRLYDIQISLNTLFRNTDFFITEKRSVWISFIPREKVSSVFFRELLLKRLTSSETEFWLFWSGIFWFFKKLVKKSIFFHPKPPYLTLSEVQILNTRNS